METLFAILAVCVRGIPRSPVNSPYKSQLRFDFFYLRGWVNNREASDLRPDHVHYDVTEMVLMSVAPFTNMV